MVLRQDWTGSTKIGQLSKNVVVVYCSSSSGISSSRLVVAVAVAVAVVVVAAAVGWMYFSSIQHPVCIV